MLPALCLKRLKEKAPFIRRSTLSNYHWTQVHKLRSLNIGYQSTRLSLQLCCCANHRFLSHSREWRKLNACFGSSVRSRWALLSWFDRCRWDTLPLFFTIPSEAAEEYLDLYDEFHDANKCWLHTWNGPCPRSQSHWCWRMPTLPRHSTKWEVPCTPNKGRPGWRQEPPRRSMVEALWKPDLQGNWAEGYPQYNRIPLRIWPSTPQVWYYHAPYMIAFLMLLYAIYCLITAPVSTRPKDSNTLT